MLCCAVLWQRRTWWARRACARGARWHGRGCRSGARPSPTTTTPWRSRRARGARTPSASMHACACAVQRWPGMWQVTCTQPQRLRGLPLVTWLNVLLKSLATRFAALHFLRLKPATMQPTACLAGAAGQHATYQCTSARACFNRRHAPLPYLSIYLCLSMPARMRARVQGVAGRVRRQQRGQLL